LISSLIRKFLKTREDFSETIYIKPVKKGKFWKNDGAEKDDLLRCCIKRRKEVMLKSHFLAPAMALL
jgi:hypothetical protein